MNDLERYVTKATRARQRRTTTKAAGTFCGGCDRPHAGSTLCTDCAAQLAVFVGEIPWVVEQLRLSYTRQVKFSQRGPIGKATEQPLVINLASAETASDYATTITRWQGRLADHDGQPVRYPDPITAALWIARNAHALTTFTDAGKMLDDIESAHRRALAVINRPPDKWFTGYCSATTDEQTAPCPVPLYADAEATTVTCPRCQTEHDVADRRGTMLEQAEDTLVTAAEAARAIVVLSDYDRGENRLVRRIGMWSTRKRIEERGTLAIHGRDRPLYRLGDILQLLADDHAAAS